MPADFDIDIDSWVLAIIADQWVSLIKYPNLSLRMESAIWIVMRR